MRSADLSPSFSSSREPCPPLLLLPFALRRGGWRILSGRWRALALYTAAEVCIPWQMLSQAEARLASSLSGPPIATDPLIALLFAKSSSSAEVFGPARLAGLAID